MPEQQFHPEYLKSIKNYPKQFEMAWDEVHKLTIPEDLNPIRDVVIAGMGGSNFGARVVKSAFEDNELIVPIEILHDYNLPSFCDEETLVILTSYSGTTEEVISVLKQAVMRGCKVFGITSGGRLKQVIDTGSIYGYVFDAKKFNPSGAPRTGIGYVLGATIATLSVLGLLNYKKKDFENTLEYMNSFINVFSKEDRMPFQLAQKLYDKIPVFISAEHLNASAWIWRNFFNETSKQNAFHMEVPELNHHFLDGLFYPKEDKNRFIFVFLKSELYSPRVQKRFEITKGIVRKQGFMDISVSMGAQKKLNEAWELIIIGSFVSYYLAKMRGVNPSTNEMVDLLKDMLKG